MAELNHILCVDDEPDVLFLERRTLEKIGKFKVTAVSGGLAALQAIEEVMPDLILLDVMMPEIDGPATLDMIRENPKYDDIPVIFMTARVRVNEIEEYINMGASGVIPKPFDPMKLPTEIKTIWDRSHVVC